MEQGRKRLVFLGDVDHAEVRERCSGVIEMLGAPGAVTIVRPKAFACRSTSIRR